MHRCFVGEVLAFAKVKSQIAVKLPAKACSEVLFAFHFALWQNFTHKVNFTLNRTSLVRRTNFVFQFAVRG